MKMLIVGKTPPKVTIEAGHYFQGRQGRVFWSMLQRYELLNVPPDKYADEMLIEHGYGITNIVKVSHEYQDEPTDAEYREWIPKFLALLDSLPAKPRVILFVYKGALDAILRLHFNIKTRSRYGFNPELESLFGSQIFAFPMPGTPCPKETIDRVMKELQLEIGA